MSLSFGLAQFALGANNAFAKESERLEVKKEAAADKIYERGRLAKIDQRADQNERRTQENHNILLEGDKLKLDEIKALYSTGQDGRNYTTNLNRSSYQESLGDYTGAAQTIFNGANSHSKTPFQLEFAKDDAGNIVSKVNDAGETVFTHNILDKETGMLIGTNESTLKGFRDSYAQMQKGEAMEEVKKEIARKRAEKVQEMQDDQSSYIAKTNTNLEAFGIEAGIRDQYDAAGAERDNNYTVARDATQHSYNIASQNNSATNSIAQSKANAYIDGGVDPIVGGGSNDGSVAGIIASLTGTESGGNSGANRTNKDGRSFGGLLQMGDARLKDYANASGTKPITAMQFKNLSASQQSAVNNWHINDLRKAAQATGAIGRTINNVPVTLGGLVAVAHLGGKGGMQKFVQTNGRYNPKDQLNTSLTDYLKEHASGGVTVAGSPKTLPAALPSAKSSGKGSSVQSVVSVNSYTKNIDNSTATVISKAKTLYGLTPNSATSASLTQAAKSLKQIATANNRDEVDRLYTEAGNYVLNAIPEGRGKSKMTVAQRQSLRNSMLLSMTGASSAAEFLDTVYKINPAARNRIGIQTGTMLPGQQPRTVQATPQTGKLAALYSRGLPAVKTSPNAGATLKSLENLSDDIDW